MVQRLAGRTGTVENINGSREALAMHDVMLALKGGCIPCAEEAHRHTPEFIRRGAVAATAALAAAAPLTEARTGTRARS